MEEGLTHELPKKLRVNPELRFDLKSNGQKVHEGVFA